LETWLYGWIMQSPKDIIDQKSAELRAQQLFLLLRIPGSAMENITLLDSALVGEAQYYDHSGVIPGNHTGSLSAASSRVLYGLPVDDATDPLRSTKRSAFVAMVLKMCRDARQKSNLTFECDENLDHL
jgi:hypothetical protein